MRDPLSNYFSNGTLVDKTVLFKRLSITCKNSQTVNSGKECGRYPYL